MLATDGATIRFTCSQRRWSKVVDLRPLVLDNPVLSLWNRRPPCPKCAGHGFFHGSPRQRTPHLPFTRRHGQGAATGSVAE